MRSVCYCLDDYHRLNYINLTRNHGRKFITHKNLVPRAPDFVGTFVYIYFFFGLLDDYLYASSYAKAVSQILFHP